MNPCMSMWANIYDYLFVCMHVRLIYLPTCVLVNNDTRSLHYVYVPLRLCANDHVVVSTLVRGNVTYVNNRDCVGWSV